MIHISQESGLPGQMFEIYQKALDNQLKTFFENSRIAYDLWMDLTSYALALSSVELSKVDFAKTYIDQNYYRDDLSLDLVAESAGISKYYLCKEFHKKYGLSPGKYLKELRISQACRLLTTNGDHTMQDIAQMVGYSNNNYFGNNPINTILSGQSMRRPDMSLSNRKRLKTLIHKSYLLSSASCSFMKEAMSLHTSSMVISPV